MNKITIKDFSGLVKVYFGISLFFGIIIPPGIGELFPAFMDGVEAIVYFMPGIKNIAQYSYNQDYIKAYYAIQWILFPLLCFFLFGAMSPKKNSSRTAEKLPCFIFLYSILFFILSMLMIYLFGFHYKEHVDGFTGSGRVSALLYMLSKKYVVAVASPAIFLTTGGLFVASVLIMKNACFTKRGNR